ncbi:24825_t:CDS:2 [Dentiscutata erythropus]|uniref:24825_t:CDS:1 n=1 Tax=Dentiscutata erythropus TaxID=1348616 RepID=A0A9N9P7M0_9GLOM|nr:24825_t:CDS:2 [Dentiscutata erythropus]
MGFRIFVCLSILLSFFITTEVYGHWCIATATSTLSHTKTVCGKRHHRPTGLICGHPEKRHVPRCSWTTTRTVATVTCTPVCQAHNHLHKD